MLYIVYKTTNLVNGKFYIGVHKQKESQREFDGYYGSGKILWQAIEKYGKDNFKRVTLFHSLTHEQAYQKEYELLKQLSKVYCYNIHEGGHGGFEVNGRQPCQKGVNNSQASKQYYLDPDDIMARPRAFIPGLEPSGWIPSLPLKAARGAYTLKLSRELKKGTQLSAGFLSMLQHQYFSSLALPGLIRFPAE